MTTVIEVHGPNAEVEAKAIAAHYGVQCAPQSDGLYWSIETNDALENALCINEEEFYEALLEVEAATGVHINPDDVEF